MSALDLGEEQFLTEGPRKSDPLGEALVLIVDSDPSSAEFMARALTQSEMQVVIADRIAGSDGASMQLRTQPSIGVVVIDPLAVPGRDNLTELREAGLAEDIQVIVVAEPVILGRYAQAARGEIADFLPKPVARRTLLRAVLEAQKRHHSLRNSRLREVDQAPGSNIERLIERASLVPSARRAPIRDPSSELGLLQLLGNPAGLGLTLLKSIGFLQLVFLLLKPFTKSLLQIAVGLLSQVEGGHGISALPLFVSSSGILLKIRETRRLSQSLWHRGDQSTQVCS